MKLNLREPSFFSAQHQDTEGLSRCVLCACFQRKSENYREKQRMSENVGERHSETH